MRFLVVLFCTAAGTALAGSTVVSSGNGVAIVSGTGVAVGDVVVGRGPAKTEERRPAPFTALVIDAPVDMSYAAGGPPLLKLTAPANILPLVTTEVSAGRLVIGLKKSVSMNGPIRIEATGPSPAAIALDATGELRARNLSGPRLRLEISGSGSLTAAGQVDALSVDVSGSGSVEAAALKSREAAVEVSGSGTVAVQATAAVRVDVSGAGDVTVSGKPKQRQVDRSGAGSVVFK